MSILITQALWNNKKQDILIEENAIVKIAPHLTDTAEHIINAKGMVVFPAFYNAHTHAAMTLFRSYGDDITLQEWLTTKIWPVESKLMGKEIFAGAKLACLEMIKSGTVFFNDMYFDSLQTAKAAEEMGMRAALGEIFLDVLLNDDPANIKARAKKTMVALKEYPLIIPTLSPHAIYTVNKENLLLIKELANQLDVRLHMHLSETEKEVNDCLQEHGKRPVEYLAELGLLSERLIAAHSVWLSDKEIDLLADHRVHIAHCPTSNMKLSVNKALLYQKMEQRGMNVALGTDGCASNNNLDMMEAMKFAALLAKFSHQNPTVLPAGQALSMATINGAKAFGLEIGIAEGKTADLILVDLKKACAVPNHNSVANVVYAANSGCVDTTICNGKILMQGRIVKGEEKILEEAERAAERLFGSKD